MHKWSENAQKIAAKSPSALKKAPNPNKTPARKASREICQQSKQSQQNLPDGGVRQDTGASGWVLKTARRRVPR